MNCNMAKTKTKLNKASGYLIGILVNNCIQHQLVHENDMASWCIMLPLPVDEYIRYLGASLLRRWNVWLDKYFHLKLYDKCK